MKYFACARCLLAILCLVVTACDDKSAPTTAAGNRKIRLQLNWVPEPEFGGIYAAEQDGLFKAEGLEVEIIKGASGTSVPQLIAQGACEAGVVSGDQVLTLREQGGDIVATYSIFERSPMGFMVRQACSADSLEKVWKGSGTIALEPGMPFLKWLEKTYGPSTRKMIPYGGSLVVFQNDPETASQCFVTAEPVEMDLKKIPVKVFDIAESGYDPLTAVVCSSSSWLQANRESAEKLARAMRAGWTHYMNDPAKYNPAIARLNPSMTLEAMNIAAERMRKYVLGPWTLAHGLGSMDPQRWKTMVSQMQTLGQLTKSVAPAEVMLELLPAEPYASSAGASQSPATK
ncbi:MAG: ABC transporter substrate-binding protein [Planctomycetes bacterium]|nr:ABC transporter substrate-binding protein [Planctomycetota bacterium]